MTEQKKGKIIVAKQFTKVKTLLDRNGNVVEEVVTVPGGNEFEARRQISQAIRSRKSV